MLPQFQLLLQMRVSDYRANRNNRVRSFQWKTESSDSNNEVRYQLPNGHGAITKKTEIIITDRERKVGRGSDEIELRPFEHELD